MWQRALPSLLWALTGGQALAEPLCARGTVSSAVPPGNIQGALPNLRGLIHKETSGMGSASGCAKAWPVVSRIIGSWNVMIAQLLHRRHGNFALSSAELTEGLETAQLPGYHWKQNIPRGPAASLGQQLPVPDIPLAKISELLVKSLPVLSSVWAETEQLLLGFQSGVCLCSSLWFSANINL